MWNFVRQQTAPECDMRIGNGAIGFGTFNPHPVRAAIARHRDKAIVNLGYDSVGTAEYLPEFRNSWDLHYSFIPPASYAELDLAAGSIARRIYGVDTTDKQFDRICTIYAQTAGKLGLHADAANRQGVTWQPTNLAYRKLTILAYLNTYGQDFEGGELVFPNVLYEGKPFEYKPKAGEFIVFPSNPNYCHRVNASNGERNIIGMFTRWNLL